MGGEVHHGVYSAQSRRERGRIAHVAPYQFKPVSEEGMSGREIVVDYNLVPATAQCAGCMASYVTGSSHHQNDQLFSPVGQVSVPISAHGVGGSRISRSQV
jgi:hypothetical protein